MENKLYKIWWNEIGAQPTWFEIDEMEKFAKKYNFDSEELLKKGDIDFTWDDGEVYGGVFLTDEEA